MGVPGLTREGTVCTLSRQFHAPLPGVRCGLRELCSAQGTPWIPPGRALAESGATSWAALLQAYLGLHVKDRSSVAGGCASPAK